MNSLIQIFHYISSASLVPVELALLIALALVLRNLGATARDALIRRRAAKTRGEVEGKLERRELDALGAVLESGKRDAALDALAALVEATVDRALLEKRLAEFESAAKERCARPESLAKAGPALGLVGTLIPLGPALLGLASADLNALATNLSVAFSTTVVGLIVALFSAWDAASRKKRARRDFALLNFAADRLLEASEGGGR